MESPRHTTPEDWSSSPESPPQSLYCNNPTPPDTPPTNPIWQLTELEAYLRHLAHNAAECYQERLEHDTKSVIFFRSERENKRAKIDGKLATIRDLAAAVKPQRDALRRKIPQLSTYDPVDDLEMAFLQIEQQRLAGVLGTIDHVEEQFALTRDDIEGVQDPVVRDAFDNALEKVQLALWDFRRVFDDTGRERSRVIDDELMRFASGGWWRRSGSSLSSSSPSPSSPSSSLWLPDDVDSGLGSSAMDIDTLPDTLSRLTLSPLTLSPSVAEHVGGVTTTRTAAEKEYMTERLFRFERNDPPTLLRLANWLGLDDAVHAALLLNSGPVQNAFATYSASRRESPSLSDSIAENPERLRLVMLLDTFSRETLLTWREGVGSGREERSEKTDKWAGLDFDAALFAHLVVRFLENSCEEVEWKPVAGRVASLGDYDVAKWRWAVVLQMLWFLEKAFAPVEMAGPSFV
ncbi:hypothetical protein F5B18DRAFT_351890 [Nemania serpens]|nr:hypothetical protein F5B18DRAFT_351890 [Nemania serpens]